LSSGTPFNRLQRLNWKENRHEILCLPAQIGDFGPCDECKVSKMYSIQTSKSSTDDEFTVQTLKHAGNEMGMLSNSILHFSMIQKTPVMDLKL